MEIDEIKKFANKLNKTKVFDLLDGYLGLMNNISNGLLDGVEEDDTLMSDCKEKALAIEKQLYPLVDEAKKFVNSNMKLEDKQLQSNVDLICSALGEFHSVNKWLDFIKANSDNKIKEQKQKNFDVRKKLKKLKQKISNALEYISELK